MNKFVKTLIVICLLSFSWMPAQAVPAFPGEISYTQPDGTVVKYYVRGDERHHWLESVQGHLLEKDGDGYLVYACRDGQEALRYTGNDAEAAVKMQLLSPHDVTVTPRAVGDASLSLGSSFPTTGKRKLLMLLVNFANTETQVEASVFDDMMNAEGYNGTGSFRDYYLENSYDQLDIETTVVGWIQLSMSKYMYSTTDMTTLIVEALNAVDDEIDFTQYDNDGDGVLDGLSIIHQGYGQEVTGSSSDIWSHSGDLLSNIYVDGVRVRTYTIQPELFYGTTPMTLGVFCHEFGHNLGAPDFYDTDYESNGGTFEGTGVWDIMSGGCWNGVYEQGDSPTHFNMWQKMQFGWVVPQYLNESCTVADIPSASLEPVGYIIKTQREGDYFVLENRTLDGFDCTLPGYGLIIYHADENRISQTVSTNSVNSDCNQGLYTVCASATTEPGTTVASYGNINSAGAPFPGNTGASEFSDYTTPSAHSNDGKYAYFSLRNIHADGATASFDFVRKNTPDTVQNFKASARRGVVALKWEAPANGVVSAYRIFRDGEHIASTTDLSYIDHSLTATVATYQVDVQYDDGMYSPFVTSTVRVPDNKIEAVAAEQANGGITLTWELNSMLTRMNPDLTTAMSNAYIQTIQGSSMVIAHRFAAQDLVAYEGYTIERVRFFPYTSPQEVSYKVQVYRAEEGGEPELVSERNVGSYGSGNWTRESLRLTTPVTIEAGYDYLIAFAAESTIGTVTVACDNTTYDPGLGNLVYLDGEWRSDVTSANIFLYATLVPYAAAVDDFIAGESPIFAPSYDPSVASFPIGYNVYRDDELLGFTSTGIYIDTTVEAGSHTYGIACLYQGDNESELKELSVTYSPASVGNLTMSNGARVYADGKQIYVTTPEPAAVTVYTVDGKLATREQVAAGTTAIDLGGVAGIYIVKIGSYSATSTHKTVLK